MKSKQPYHHGNLKQALLDAALQLVRTPGPEEFTLREVARRAGVSHNAPYRHFRDKADLMAAVATEGYNHLSESMAKAMKSGKNAYEKLDLSTEGFIRFALRYPDHFKVIFDAPRRYEYPETHEAGERTFGILIKVIEQCQAEGIIRPGNSRMLALVYLGMAIGIAKLATTDRLPFKDDAEVIDFDRSVGAALTRGYSPEMPRKPSRTATSGKQAGKKVGAKKRARPQKPPKP